MWTGDVLKAATEDNFSNWNNKSPHEVIDVYNTIVLNEKEYSVV